MKPSRLIQHILTVLTFAAAVFMWATSMSRMLISVSCVPECSARSILVAVTNTAEWTACCVLLFIFVAVGVQAAGTRWVLGFLSIVIVIDVAGYGVQDLNTRIPVFALLLWLVRRRNGDRTVVGREGRPVVSKWAQRH